MDCAFIDVALYSEGGKLVTAKQGSSLEVLRCLAGYQGHKAKV